MNEDIVCKKCGESNWTYESVGKEIWLTCKCGHEQEKSFDEFEYADNENDESKYVEPDMYDKWLNSMLADQLEGI